jgi:hypothetical protein
MRVVPKLQVGAEFNAAADEVAPIATWFLLTEEGARPAAFIGTSSDRIGSPAGTQSYYLTVAKNVDFAPISFYGTLNYSEWDDGINFPFGANVEVAPGFTVQPMYDGDRGHLMAVYSAERYSVSLIAAWFQDFGIAFSAGF